MTTERRVGLRRTGVPDLAYPNRSERVDALLGARAQSLLLDPSWVAIIFWAACVVAIVTPLVLVHWPRRSFVAAAALAAFCAIGSGIRGVAGRRLPRWSLHVDIGLATVLVSVLAAIGTTRDVDFADLYVWIALFAALYFRPSAVIAHIAGAGGAYVVVLSVGPKVAHPMVEWLARFGSVAVAAGTVLALVSVLRFIARKDPLTGLDNRRSWDERLEEELERSRRTGQPLSVAMIDLDGFKAVNDREGHAAGDRLLQQLARAWRFSTRTSGDFVARLGGDEFGVLAPGAAETGIALVSRRLIDVAPEGASCSIGTATWDGIEGGSDFVRRADQAMYEMKLRHRREKGLSRA